MRGRRSVGRLRLSLLVLNVALLALISARYTSMGQTTAAETVAVLTPANVSLELPEPAASLPPFAQFDSIVERALFHDTRRPLAEEPETAAPVGSLEGYQLKGTIIRPDARIAVLEQIGQTIYLRASEGEVVGGWQLKQVDVSRAVFELRGRSMVLEIAPFEPAPPPEAEETTAPAEE